MEPNAERKIRVLIVDDSAIVRKLLAEALAIGAGYRGSGHGAGSLCRARQDPEPAAGRADAGYRDAAHGRLTFLKKLMQFPSDAGDRDQFARAGFEQNALEALQYGAVEVLAKPGGPYSVGELKHDLPHKVRAAAHARLRQVQAEAAMVRCRHLRLRQLAPGQPHSTIIAMGASTGGTEAHSRGADGPARVHARES